MKRWEKTCIIGSSGFLELCIIAWFAWPLVWLHTSSWLADNLAGRDLTLRPVPPEAVVKSGRLAPLPESATEVQCEGWSGIFTGETYMRFEAAPEDIERFISSSPSLKGQEPSPISVPTAIPVPGHEGFEEPHPLIPSWYNAHQIKRGRVLVIPPNDDGHNWGDITIDDDNHVVYIEVTWS